MDIFIYMYVYSDLKFLQGYFVILWGHGVILGEYTESHSTVVGISMVYSMGFCPMNPSPNKNPLHFLAIYVGILQMIWIFQCQISHRFPIDKGNIWEFHRFPIDFPQVSELPQIHGWFSAISHWFSFSVGRGTRCPGSKRTRKKTTRQSMSQSSPFKRSS